MDNIVKSRKYGYSDRKKIMDSLCDNFKFINRTVIGKSCSGRNITALTVGRGEENILLTAAFHGSEYITATVLLMFLEELARTVQTGGKISGFDLLKILEKRRIIFVPCVNPDGCEISAFGQNACPDNRKDIQKICRGNFALWNSNLRGVDLNHNFNAGWETLKNAEIKAGKLCPSSTRFGGNYPESEPETKAIGDLCRKVKIIRATALHSQGEVIYWRYGKPTEEMCKLAADLSKLSGYKLDDAEGLAYGGGFKDWFISEFNRPAFTFELGKGKNPLPDADALKIYKKIREALFYFAFFEP